MEELTRLKKKHNTYKETKKYNCFNLTKVLITIICTLLLLIILKTNKEFKKEFYKYVYEDNISFTKINSYYKKYLGEFFPNLNGTREVFNEKLKYYSTSIYVDGVKLIVDDNYLVPSITGGIVVFIGEKEPYGNTIIIQGNDGVDIWYCNISDISVKLYDYIESGSFIGTTINDSLYLVFKKDGEILSYEDYL